MEIPNSIERIDLFEVMESDVQSRWTVGSHTVLKIDGKYYAYISEDSYVTRVEFDEQTLALSVFW